MMMFRTVQAAIVQLLGSQSAGQFQVVGYQRQSKASDEMLGNNRIVQVYYSDGTFPKPAGRMRGPKTHDISIEIDMSASAMARGDLTVLDSPTATPQQKAAALLAIRTAADVADTQVDELIELVYQIMMDARNFDIGLPKGDVASRWIDRIQKDTALERGDLVVKTANMKYSCRVQETVPGDIGFEPPVTTFSSSVKIGDTEGAGVLNEIDNT